MKRFLSRLRPTHPIHCLESAFLVLLFLFLPSAASSQILQTFYIPIDETHVRDVAFAINPNTGDTTHSVVSISATANGTTVYYDHWEDGYEADPENPVQASTETFNLDAGDFQALESDIVLNPRDPAVIAYDGRDRLSATEQIAVTRAGWRLLESTLLAGAIEVFPTLDWRQAFDFPLGEDIASSQSFEYVAASIMAGDTGAIFDIDADGDGTVDSTITLGQGEATLVTGINTGGTISSSDPLQVALLTGDVGSTFASRWFVLVPTEIWGSSYYSPVSSVATSENRIFLFNPGSSAITVTHETISVTVTTRTYDNTTTGAVDETATPCAAPLVRTFNVPDTFTVNAARLGLNVTHTYRGDIQATLISPGGTSRTVIATNGGDGNDNYDVLIDSTSGNALNDGNVDNTAAPFYDRTVGGVIDFSGEAANGTWTLQVCDAFGGDSGTFNRAQLQLDEPTGTSTNTGTVSVPAGGIAEFTVPINSAAHFFTAGDEHFFATAAVDWNDTSSDWGFSLLPEEALATATVAGWAIGRDPASPTNPTENGSPIWVTAVAATDLYVDFDGDPTTGVLVDVNGNRYDQLISVNPLESVRLLDPSDTDQSGTRIYTLDGTLIAAAWGQDATTASAAAPAVDVGTTVLPLDALRALKEGSLLDDADGDGALGAGDTMEYRIVISNVSEAVVSNATLEDFGLDSNLTYVADSTEIDGLAVADDTVGATIFPLDEGGQLLADIGIGQSVVVTFAVLIADPLPAGVEELLNQVRVSTSTQIEVGSTLTTVKNPALSITKTSNVVDDVVAGQIIDYTVTIDNISGDAARGIKVIDGLPPGTSYVTESTSATGFTDVFSGTVSVSDAPAGGIAFNEGSNPCPGTPLVRTFSVGSTFTIADVDLGFNAAHTFRSDIQAVLESPAGTRVTVLDGVAGDGDNNYDILLDDESVNPLDDGSPDNTAAPFYDRDVIPDNALSAFDGESSVGTWTLEICDDAGGDNGTYNRAELRLSGSTSTAITRTNQAAAVNPLMDGDPTYLVLAPDGFGLLAGQSMTVTYQVMVDDPLALNSTAITNTALVTALEQVEPLTATVVDPVTNGAAIGDRVWLDVDGDGFQDVGETGIANVTVHLYDPGGDGAPGGGDDTLIATLVTDLNGNYLFDHLPAGSYYVDVDGATVPTGLTTSPGTTDPSAVITVNAEEIRTDIDFGYTNADPNTAIIGDFIWSDADGDGVQDPGEPGIGGVTVELLNSAGSVVATVVTADDGSYLFTGVAAGEYRARVAASNFSGGNALDGYTVTSGPQSEGGNTSDPVTVIAGDVVTDVDFGYQNSAGTYSITDALWLDVDSDGAFDPSESGIAGTTVALLDASGDVIATTLVAADGSFSFDGVEPGNYTISITDHTGELIGLKGTTTAGSNRELSVTVVAADVTGQNFGFNGEALLGDRIWSDADGDGVQDENEVGLAGITVELLDRLGAVIATTTTDAFGNYLFEGIAPNRYSVRVDNTTLPAGFTQTGDPDATLDHQSSSILTLGDADLVLDFGYQNTSLADISGNVFSDLDRDGIDDGVGEPGFTDVTIALLDSSGNVIATTKTDANGDYTFPDLPAGDYTVEITDEGGVLNDYLLTSGLDSIDVTLAGTDITGIDFGYARNAGTGAIGDFVWLDADRDGVQDAGESGLSGIDLDLYDVGPDGAIGGGDDVLIASTTTDANGGYVFPDVAPGSYYVDVDGVPSGLSTTTGTTDPSSIVLLSEGEHFTEADFGYAGTNGAGAIGDRVWADVDGDGVQDPGEIGIGGVTLTVVGPSGTFTTATAEDGSWLVTGLAPGTYTVTVDSSTLPSSYDTAPTNGPASREYLVIATADVLTADFGFDGTNLSSIGDTVFLDEDGDGSQDAGEAGISGVTVDLLDSGGNVVATTTTDSSGNYDFVGLAAGDYQVRVTDVGQVLTGLNLSAGTNPTSTINLAPGQDYDDADFPYAPSNGSGTIGSIVWNDIDGDGVRDVGFEPGLQGVTLALWHDINGNGVIEPGTDNLLRSTTTDENGEYEFVGLVPGSYLVDVTDTSGVLTGFTKTSGSAGVDDNSQADPYAVVLTSGSLSNDTADFGYQANTPLGISGTVFGDDNSDAAQNGSEAGVAGVPVILYLDLDGDGVIDPEDPQIATTISNGSGDYAFTGLPDGRDYIVAVQTGDTAIEGQTQTTQTATGGVQPVTLSGSSSTGNDFGFVDSAPEVVNPAVIGDRVWLDTDGDGVQDVGEPGIPNVDLELYDVGLDGAPGGGDDVLVATTTTGANGTYSFGGLDAGTYYVDVDATSLPAGLTTSAGTSDPSSAVTVALGDVIDTVDFGYSLASDAAVGNYVWSDADNDGRQDPGESGIGGVTVDLVSAGPDGIFGTVDDVVEATTTTTDDGWYLFTGVSAGEYRVDVTDTGNVLIGYSLTSGPQSSNDPTDPFTIADGDVYDDADFGYRDATLFDISDRLWQDIDGDGTQDVGELGIGGVTLNLLDDSGDVIATTVTDGNGDFTFSDLQDGNYTLSVSDTGAVLREFVGTTPPATADALAVTLAGADVSAVSFGYNQPGIVGDTVFSDSDGDDVQDPGELGIGGVTVALWQDADGNGIFDSTVDTFIGNQITNADGSYLFEGLPQGTFFASIDSSQPALTGYSATTPDEEVGVNAAGVQIEASLANSAASFLAADFGYQNTALPDVSGNVFNDVDRDGIDDGAGEPGFLGVTLELRNAGGEVIATTVTDANGDYSFLDVPAGSYTVAVTDEDSVLDGYLLTSSLDEVPITVAAGDITGIDFGYARDASTGSIGDRVWLDSDGDGIQDGAETGLGGATVELYDPGPDGAVGGGDDVLLGTAVTDANGNYAFSGLAADLYYAQLDTSSLPNGGSGLVVSTANPTAIIALSEGEQYTEADFGVASAPTTGAIGDRVWFDADGDGLQDPGETGISGVEILLTGPGCAPCTTTTGADGTYMFTGLAAGDYKVDFNPATLPVIYDPSPTNTTGNIDVDGLAGGDLVTSADFGFGASGSIGSIGDLVFLDLDGDGNQDAGEPGIEGVTIDLLDAAGTTVLASTSTDSAGAYSFLGLDAGTYQVRVTDTAGVLSGLNLSAGSNPTGAIVLTAGQNYVDADFGYAPSGGTGAIGNLVWHDTNGDGDRDAGESGMQGVTLELWHDTNGNGVIEPGTDNLVRTTTTDINGEYVFTGLPDGDYLVDVTDDVGVLTGFTKTSGVADTNNNSQADPYAITVSGGSVETADFGYQAGTNFDILGTTFFDIDASGTEDPVDFGVEEVEAFLYIDLDGDGVIDPEDPRIGVTTVDANGDYIFEDLPNGNYIVAVDAGGTFVDGARQTTQLLTNSVEPVTVAGADSTDNDFGFNRTATLALVTEMRAWSGRGGTTLEWHTTAEAGTAGFHVYQVVAGQPVLVSEFVPSLDGAAQGARYRLSLPSRSLPSRGAEIQVLLEEVERTGTSQIYGPYRVTVEGSEPTRGRAVSKSAELCGSGYEVAPLAPDHDRVMAASAFLEQAAVERSVKAIGDRLRITVEQDGLQVVFTEAIADGLGIDLLDAQQAIDSAQLRLVRADQGPVAYLPVDQGLVFVGKAIQDQIYTTEEVYWLEPGAGIHMSVVDGGPAVPTAGGSLTHEQQFEEDAFAATFVARDPDLDYWHWRGLIADHSTLGSTDFQIALPDLVDGTEAQLTLHFRGASYSEVPNEHHAEIEIDGQWVGETYFDGLGDHSAAFDLAAGTLVDGATLRVIATLDTGATRSFFYVDSYDLKYQRRTQTSYESFEGRFGGESEVTVEGFVATDLLVLDTTERDVPAIIGSAIIDPNQASVWATFGRPAGAQTFRVQSLGSAVSPQVEAVSSSHWLDPSNAAAYLVIAPESLMSSAQRLADLRRGEFGSSLAVSVRDIMDELAGGRFHPPAIREFLAYAVDRWSVPPTHVALLGRGSLDYRDLQGLAGDPLPPLMTATPFGLYSADASFADIDGDSRPDVALGRIPASTPEEADAYIDKVMAYEASSGLWQRRALLLADNDDMGGDFSSEMLEVATVMPPDLEIETGSLGSEGTDGLRDRLFSALDRGVGLVDWMGHGGLDRLAEEGVLVSSDVAGLDHGVQPVFALLSCNAARFELPGFWSLAEELVLADSGGIAVIAPTGLALNVDSFDANRMFVRELYHGGHDTLGEVFQAVIRRFVDVARLDSDPRVYMLVGDPALRTDLSGLPSAVIFTDGFESGDTSRWSN